jgi:hypothetical protein
MTQKFIRFGFLYHTFSLSLVSKKACKMMSHDASKLGYKGSEADILAQECDDIKSKRKQDNVRQRKV